MTASPMFPGFDGLMTLSRREGVDIRPTLLRVLTDLYVQARAHSAGEARQFVELTSRLIDQVDDATRAAVRARLAIYPGTPAEIASKLGLKPAHGDMHVPVPAEIPVPPPTAAPAKVPSEAEKRLASNLSMQPNDAAEISDMFFGASASERALILYNLHGNAAAGLGADSRCPRGARDPDTGNGGIRHRRRELHAGVGRGPDIAGADRGPGGQRSRRRAAGLRGKGGGYAERRVPARAAVPQSRIRIFGAQCLPIVAPVRPLERTIGADHAGGMARLHARGHPRKIPSIAVRRRTPSHPRQRPARPVLRRSPAQAW